MFLNLGTAPQGPPPPFSAWSSKQIHTIERAIARAWSQITADPHCQEMLTSGTEPQITAVLQDTLCELLNAGQVAGFSPATYLCPIRGQELDDHTGNFLEKRPDLTFPRLSSRPASNHNALFFECKILGRGRTLDDYVRNGVRRFQEGIYAWAMPHAGMLAYVVGVETADPCSALAATWSSNPGPAAPFAPIEPVSSELGVPAIALSQHARTFTLRNGEAPGQIMLRHLWLHFPINKEDSCTTK